ADDLESAAGAPLERELLGPSCVVQGVYDRLEQAFGGPGVLGCTTDQARRHDGRLTYDDEQPTPDFELALKAFVRQWQGAGDSDGVVALAGVGLCCQGVRGDNSCIADTEGCEIALGELGELGKYFDGFDMSTDGRQTRRHKSRSRTD